MYHHISGHCRQLLVNDTSNIYLSYILKHRIRNNSYLFFNVCSKARLSTHIGSRNFLGGKCIYKNESAGFSSKPLSERVIVFPLSVMTNLSGSKGTVLHISARNFSEQIDISGQGWLYKGMYDSPPVLYAQELLLHVHDISCMPWWATIVMTTVVLRTTVTFPLALYQNYILAKLDILQLQLKEISKEMGKETSLAVKRFNWTEKQAKAVYIRSMKKQWREMIVKENCHPAKAGLLMLVQVPMWISLSLSLRNLVFMLPTPDPAAQVTAWELSGGGALWFHNLLLSDSTWILPVMLGLVNLTIVEVQNLSRIKQSGKFQKILTNIFRGVSIAMIPLAASVPSCLSLYWLTSSTVGLLHNLLLLSPRVRSFVGIPQTNLVSKQPYRHIYTQLRTRLGLTAPPYSPK
ncbi:hypothetical protein R5R35_003191 [Gryllus longicercus]|uniref:Membrane insertase YidC/Oxa/ALB C-terminal domain-containing protein n=1 Tax=Gryllus longicercus TaxID=2509291 RepID=A0AAN9Z4V1_9ORTH